MNIYKEYAIKMIGEINDEELLKRAYSLIQYLWAKDSTSTIGEEQNNEKTDTQQGNENCQQLS